MHCPRCRNDTRVMDSPEDHRNDGKRRRRECKQCGYRFTSLEITYSEFKGIKKRILLGPTAPASPA